MTSIASAFEPLRLGPVTLRNRFVKAGTYEGMNFGNAPLIPDTAQLVCVNGSFEELEMNRSADHVLLSDPGAFLDALQSLQQRGEWTLDKAWFDTNRAWRAEWVAKTLAELAQDTQTAAATGGKIHPLQLSLDVQAERRVTPGSVIVQTPTGDVDARLDTRLAQLGDVVREALAG